MEPLEFECTYHIFNRTNGSELLFKKEDNYHFFLEKLRKYILPTAEVYAYCLMPNHFHLLVKMRAEGEVRDLARVVKSFPKFQTLEKVEPAFLSKEFANLFSSYTQAFNKRFSRKGSLFMKNFKRKKVTDEKYFIKLIHYLHYNPVEANLVDKPGDWKFSSYTAILSERPTLVQRDWVLELFGDKDNFRYCHLYPPKLSGVEDL